MPQKLMEGLNPQQQEAVKTTEGPILIIAGAGAGKTTVITRRIAYLIRHCGISPDSILAVTFTNKAAKEMRERAIKLLSHDTAANMWIGTFHGICVRILKQDIKHLPDIRLNNEFSIVDTEDQGKIVKEALDILRLDTKTFPVNQMLNFISNKKSQGHAPGASAANNPWQTKANEVYAEYQKILSANNSMDFDDILIYTVQLFSLMPSILDKWQNRFSYFMIDEYQDTNFLQYKLVNLLGQKSKNVCVVGDVDQSIYSWRGADYRNILQFKFDYDNTKEIVLEQNYRSTSIILNAANSVIANNKQRPPKNLWSTRNEGEKIKLYEANDQNAEADYIAKSIKDYQKQGTGNKDIAILYRTNAQSRSIEESCIKYNIPYKIIGGIRFYERKEIKDILAYMRLALNHRDDVSFKRVVNTPKRGVGMMSVTKLQLNEGGSLYEKIDNLHKKGALSGGLYEFYEIVEEIKNYSKLSSVSTIMKIILDKTRYFDMLGDEDDGDERKANIEELLAVANEYEAINDNPSVAEFLDYTALTTNADMENDEDTVTLMTLHSAKGLEFPAVFIAGVEQGLLPSMRAEKEADIEEERRLFYVGITRAKDNLHISYAKMRQMYGNTNFSMKSMFITELPIELLDIEHSHYQHSAAAEKEKPAEVNIPQTVESYDLSIGDTVVHPTFGRGRVKDIMGKGNTVFVTVAFEGSGTRILDKRYAPLQKA